MVQGHRRVLAAVALGMAVLVAVACDPVYEERNIDPLVGEPAAESTLVDCTQANTAVVVTVSSHLDPSCTYSQGFTISGSNVVFDCRGAHIETDTGSGRGIEVSAPVTTPLANVTVRNCFVKGFLNNVRVTRDGFKSLAAGSEYVNAFSNIVIENSRLYRSAGSGVFVDGYVTDVTLRNLEIAGAGSVGVYLEAGSKDNTVEYNTIYDNGYGDVVPEGVPFSVGSLNFRYHSTGREGIAVDGSRNNRITDNTIAHNSAGGIFLYKNCGENVTKKPAQWWTRRYGADDNLIEGNAFSSQPTGVWIGSRMAENQTFMDCSDAPMVSAPVQLVYPDFAARTTVRHNDFQGIDHGVRIEDDDAVVEQNQFHASMAEDQAVVIGTRDRTAVLGHPVRNTVVRDNGATIEGNPTPYGWVYGHEGTAFENNVATDAPAELVPGPEPVINPFLFVKEFWQVS
jgi:parallel beta-helix repeat protein